MNWQRIFLVSTLSVFLSGVANAQKNHRESHHEDRTVSSKSRKASKAKGSKANTSCPVFAANKYPYQGFGIKLGDPFALSYKLYISKHLSLAADVGKASSGLYSRYNHEKFADYVMPDTLSGGATLNYLTSKVKSDWIGELKFLYGFDLKRISQGLQLYVGVGVQAKSSQVQYSYLYSKSMSENEFGKFDRDRFTLGQTTVAGIEYSYFKIPVSAFIEMELVTDFMYDPGWQRFQGGIGMRYIF